MSGRDALWHANCSVGVGGASRYFSTMNKGRTMWQKLFFGVMALLSISLTACNTVEGAGKDVTRAGQGIQEEAREHKPK